LTGYYHNIFKNCGQIATPLRKILNKEAFSWTQETTKTFEKLKDAMCTTPILATPHFTKTFIGECDAAGHRIGVVLIQEGRSLAFESNQLKG
jgi:hypothetical protein